jgi:hypothetical protein
MPTMSQGGLDPTKPPRAFDGAVRVDKKLTHMQTCVSLLVEFESAGKRLGKPQIRRNGGFLSSVAFNRFCTSGATD